MKNADNPLFRSGDPNFMTSLARGLRVIHAFGDHDRRLTIADLSRATGLTRAVVRRCVYTLGELGYIGSERNYYFLKPKVLNLGFTYSATTPFSLAAQPMLDEVTREIEAMSVAGVLDEYNFVCVAQSNAQAARVDTVLHGSRYPLYCTSVGRTLLAHSGEATIGAYLEQAELEQRTERTVTDSGRLQEILAEVRERGYAINDQEYLPGVRAIAVPVRGRNGHVLAAINATCSAERCDVSEMQQRFLPVLRSAAGKIENQLAAHEA